MVHSGEGKLLIAMGSGMIVASFFIKKFYGARGSFDQADRAIPRWIGRVIFWIVGGMMIFSGLNAMSPPR